MSKTAVLILENPWWDLREGNSNQASVLPFFEGLSRLNENIQIYYMTFTNTKGFEDSLRHLLTAPQKRLFIYVASHGYGKQLANSNFSNISKIIQGSADAQKRIEGIVFGACEIGGQHNDSSLKEIQKQTGIVWVLAYQKIMAWMPSTLIDINFMYRMLQIDPENLKDREKIIEQATSALKLFNPIEKIGWCRKAHRVDDPEDTLLKDTIRFLVKPRGRGNIWKDDTNLLINLAYPAPDSGSHNSVAEIPCEL